MDALESLDEIAEQTSFSIDAGARQRRSKKSAGKWGYSVPANLTHSKVAREKKKTPKKRVPKKMAPRPITAKSPPSAARAAAVGQLFTGYSTLIESCRIRCDQLALSRAELDRLSGLPDGYSAKLLGRDGCGPRQKRAWPVSLDAMLGALGLAVILIEDPQATARTLARREKPVNRSQQRFGNTSRHGGLRALPPPSAEEEATAA